MAHFFTGGPVEPRRRPRGGRARQKKQHGSSLAAEKWRASCSSLQTPDASAVLATWRAKILSSIVPVENDVSHQGLVSSPGEGVTVVGSRRSCPRSCLPRRAGRRRRGASGQSGTRGRSPACPPPGSTCSHPRTGERWSTSEAARRSAMARERWHAVAARTPARAAVVRAATLPSDSTRRAKRRSDDSRRVEEHDARRRHEVEAEVARLEREQEDAHL